MSKSYISSGAGNPTHLHRWRGPGCRAAARCADPTRGEVHYHPVPCLLITSVENQTMYLVLTGLFLYAHQSMPR